MADERNEQSVLISLDSLSTAADEKSAGAAKGGESGLIDIGALESAGLLDDVDADAGGPTEAVAPSSAGAVKGRRRGGGMWVGIVFGALVLIGGSVYATMMLTKKDPAPETETPAAEAVAKGGETKTGAETKAPDPKKPDPAVAAAAKKADAGATAAKTKDAKKADAGTAVAAKKPGNKPKRGWRGKKPAGKKPVAATPKPAEPTKPVAVAAAPPPKKPEPAKPKEDDVDDLLSAVRTGKAVGGSGPAGDSPSNDPLLPKSLSRGQILKVVRKNAAAVRKCKSEAGAESGTVTVKVTIAGTGSVKNASVVSAQKGSPVAGCVERKVKVFRFPQFSGKTMSVRLPFSI